MCDLLTWLNIDVGLTFAQMANVQTVGIGLYLALGVIQALSATGIAGLNRRVETLKRSVNGARINSERQNVRRLSGSVGGLEIGFHDLNRRLLISVFALFLISLGYFCYTTVWQDQKALRSGVLFIIAFYLALPVIIFSYLSVMIGLRCKAVAKRVADTEIRVQRALLGLD